MNYLSAISDFLQANKLASLRKILLILFLTPAALYAQELTADTTAVDPSLLSKVGELLWAGLVVLFSFLTTKGLPLLNAWLKQLMHFRGSAVVADALTQVLGEVSLETQKSMADGVITKEEWAVIRQRAREIAVARLSNLSGFYKKDLVSWVDDQLGILLGKLLLRI